MLGFKNKGCFVFKNGATRADKTKKTTKRKRTTSTTDTGILGKEVTEQPFYNVYRELWQGIHLHIDALQKENCARTLQDLVDYVVKQSKGQNFELGVDEILPAAALLTGINQPDHLQQFDNLSQRINEKVSASICILQSRDCATLKSAVETLVYNFIEAPHEDNEDRDHKRLRKSQCTMKQLKHWYKNNYPAKTATSVQEQDEEIDFEADVSSILTDDSNVDERHMLVVILPDFECFNTLILQDLILILSANCCELPFCLILGVATSIAAVHSALPYHVTSKIRLSVFQMQAAPVSLNEVSEIFGFYLYFL